MKVKAKLVSALFLLQPTYPTSQLFFASFFTSFFSRRRLLLPSPPWLFHRLWFACLLILPSSYHCYFLVQNTVVIASSSILGTTEKNTSTTVIASPALPQYFRCSCRLCGFKLFSCSFIMARNFNPYVYLRHFVTPHMPFFTYNAFCIFSSYRTIHLFTCTK